MNHRILPLVVLAVLVATFADVVGPGPLVAEQPATALVYVWLSSDEDVVRFEALGIPVYARLGHDVLSGVGPAALEALGQSALPFRVLDPDISEILAGRSAEGLYLVYPLPGRPVPSWGGYGRLLLDQGEHILLRMTPGSAERLSLAGVELQLLSFDPKPLRPVLARDLFPDEITPDPYVQLMIDQVVSSTAYQYVGDLSGEWPVLIGGEPYTITTRHTYSGEPIQKATQYAGEHLEALGLQVEYHEWEDWTHPNVIGEVPGMITPEDIYIICAHIDDMPPGPRAPGADDNASGSTAVLIAADILTRFHWGCTLRFALWTGEEQGLQGSRAYARRSYDANENIVSVLNLDMIAWNTPQSSPDIDLVGNVNISGTMELAQLFADVVEAYDLNLIPQVRSSAGGSSDHYSFWQYGYMAMLGIEDFGDFNPYYHTPQDLLEHVDIAYFTEFVRASLGTLAHMSNCLIREGIGYLDGHVTTAGSGAPVAGADVTIYDQAGHAYPLVTDGSGYYTRTLVTGSFTVTVSAYGHFPATVTNVLVLTDTVTTQDFALQLAPTHVVSGTVTEAGTGAPLVAQVRFLETPVEVSTDPATGFYQATVAEGSYTMQVRADRHRSQERPVVVDRDQTQDFGLDTMPCVLLVDDDIDGPDVQAYYTTTLDGLRISYDVWDISVSGNPAIEDLTDYHTVIWFTGYPSNTTLSSGNEAVLAAYLEDAGTVFLSSEDYLADVGLTPFGRDYLGIASFTDNVSRTDPMGNVAHPIGDGLGPYTLVPPPGWLDLYTDQVDGTQSSPFHWLRSGANNSTNYDGGHFRTVFLAWPLEGLAEVGDRAEVLWAVMGWFGGCGEEGWLVGQVTDAASGDPLQGARVRAGALQATTDPSGHYTLTLSAGRYDVTAEMFGYVPRTITDVVVQAGLTTTLDLEIAACDPVHDVDFTWEPITPTVGQVITFTGMASGTLPITYTWDFGDGSLPLAPWPLVTHTYDLPGEYTVVLTVTNCVSATATVTHTITVVPAPPAWRVYLALVVRGW